MYIPIRYVEKVQFLKTIRYGRMSITLDTQGNGFIIDLVSNLKRLIKFIICLYMKKYLEVKTKNT